MAGHHQLKQVAKASRLKPDQWKRSCPRNAGGNGWTKARQTRAEAIRFLASGKVLGLK